MGRLIKENASLLKIWGKMCLWALAIFVVGFLLGLLVPLDSLFFAVSYLLKKARVLAVPPPGFALTKSGPGALLAIVGGVTVFIPLLWAFAQGILTAVSWRVLVYYAGFAGWGKAVLLPYVLEIIAVTAAAGLGLMAGRKLVRRDKEKTWLQLLSMASVVFFLGVLPLFFLSARLELLLSRQYYSRYVAQVTEGDYLSGYGTDWSASGWTNYTGDIRLLSATAFSPERLWRNDKNHKVPQILFVRHPDGQELGFIATTNSLPTNRNGDKFKGQVWTQPSGSLKIITIPLNGGDTLSAYFVSYFTKQGFRVLTNRGESN